MDGWPMMDRWTHIIIYNILSSSLYNTYSGDVVTAGLGNITVRFNTMCISHKQ